MTAAIAAAAPAAAPMLMPALAPTDSPELVGSTPVPVLSLVPCSAASALLVDEDDGLVLVDDRVAVTKIVDVDG